MQTETSLEQLSLFLRAASLPQERGQNYAVFAKRKQIAPDIALSNAPKGQKSLTRKKHGSRE